MPLIMSFRSKNIIGVERNGTAGFLGEFGNQPVDEGK
jgi:hypothetical protein